MNTGSFANSTGGGGERKKEGGRAGILLRMSEEGCVKLTRAFSSVSLRGPAGGYLCDSFLGGRGLLEDGEPGGTQTTSALAAPPARPKQKKASRMGSLPGAVPPKTARGCTSLGYRPYDCMGRIGKSGCPGRPAQRVPIRHPPSRGVGARGLRSASLALGPSLPGSALPNLGWPTHFPPPSSSLSQSSE